MNLKVEGLSVALGNHEILKNISFSVREGEFLGIIGPNGSGKSTLMKCLYRTLSPDEGKIFLGDEELASMTLKKSAKLLSVIAQHNPDGFAFAVEDVVLMGRTPYKTIWQGNSKEDHMRVRKALCAVGLEKFEKRSFATLSGGEKQRVILARALVQDTPYLLMDEPTNHLDINHQLHFMQLVRALGRTVIAVMHDLNLAWMYADRMLVLAHGEIVADGKPGEIFTPAFIRKIYGVESSILQDEKTGIHRIAYLRESARP